MNLKTQYLHLMGIDVWQRRPPRQKAASAAEAASAVPQDGVSSLEQVKRSLASEAQAEESSAPSKSERVKAVSNAQPKPEATSTGGAEGGEVSFLLTFAQFSDLTMASLYSADLAGLPDNHQRLMSSLYFALSGQKANARIQEFRWPMVKSKHIVQTREEARLILAQEEKHWAPQMVLFGAEVADLLGSESTAANTQVQVGGRQLWLLPELEHFFASPAAKRDIWRLLAPLRSTLAARGAQ